MNTLSGATLKRKGVRFISKHRRALRNLLAAAVSFLATYGVSGMLVNGENLSHSIISAIVFIFILRLTLKLFSLLPQPRRLWWCFSPLAVFFATSLVIGSNLLATGFSLLNFPSTMVKIFGGFLFWEVILILFVLKWPQIRIKIRQIKLPFFDRISNFSDKKYFVLCWLFIFCSWLPVFLSCYPGIYGYDAVYQISDYRGGNIRLKHPLIHTLLLGFFIVTVGGGLGSYEIGLAMYSILQMLVLSFCFAVVCFFVRKIKSCRLIEVLTLLFFAWFPTNPLMAISSTKDIIYAGTFVVVFVLLILGLIDHRYWYNKKFLVALTIFSFVNAIFRSQGFYVFSIASLILLFVFVGEIRYRFMGVYVSVLLLYGLYSLFAHRVGVANDDVKVAEMMSVPSVQLSRVMTYNQGELSRSEIASIKKYVPDYKYYRQESAISDNMKRSFNVVALRQDPWEFIKLWLQVGVKSPITYFDAFARLTIGLWYPDMTYRDPEAYHPYWEFDSTQARDPSWLVVVRMPPRFMRPLTTFYKKLTKENSYQKVPILTTFFSAGVLLWTSLFYVAYMIYVRHYKLLFVLAFPAALWLTIFLGPVVLYRYVYPLVACWPLMVALIFRYDTRTKLCLQ